MRITGFAGWLILSVAAPSTGVAADLSRGPDLFKPCSACHDVGPGAQHKFGPQLNGVVQRGAGTAEGYEYSAAFNTAVGNGLDWSSDDLSAYLAAPMQMMAGTKMAYPGLANDVDRDDLIAWLSAIDNDGVLPAVEKAVVPTKSVEEEPRPLAADAVVPEHGVLHLGRKALPEEIAAWDIDIRPDGEGLPDGRGDAVTGGELYDAQCAACHGVFGEGEGRWPILAGGIDTLTDERPEKTIGSYWPYLSTVYDYVRRAMPFGNARSLSDDDVYAITAYLMYLNDLVDEDFELSSENFTEVRLPNESGFIADTRDTEGSAQNPDELCMSDCLPGVATVTQRARVLDVTPDNVDDDAHSAGGMD